MQCRGNLILKHYLAREKEVEFCSKNVTNLTESDLAVENYRLRRLLAIFKSHKDGSMTIVYILGDVNQNMTLVFVHVVGYDEQVVNIYKKNISSSLEKTKALEDEMELLKFPPWYHKSNTNFYDFSSYSTIYNCAKCEFRVGCGNIICPQCKF
jgi:hypothetical protein